MLLLSADRRLLSACCFGCNAAFAGGNGAAVWAGARMSQEGADALRGFRRKDVLKLARLLRDFFLVVNMKSLGEEPFRQTVAADHVFRALAALLSEDDHVVAMAGEVTGGTKSDVAAIQHLLVRVRLQGVFGQVNQAQDLHALQR